MLAKQGGSCSLHFMRWHARQIPGAIQSADKIVNGQSRVRHGAMEHSAIPFCGGSLQCDEETAAREATLNLAAKLTT